AIRIPMMAMTTSSSTSVNASLRRRFGRWLHMAFLALESRRTPCQASPSCYVRERPTASRPQAPRETQAVGLRVVKNRWRIGEARWGGTMDETFDPYHKWLGIPPKDQPPHHYRLLGLDLFEADPDVIEHAADQRMRHIRTMATGKHTARSQQILNEIAAARVCLLNPQQKGDYDARLQEQLPGKEAP